MANFKHDCDKCILLSSTEYKFDDNEDLYLCPNSSIDKKGSIVVRYSDEGSDYESFPVKMIEENSGHLIQLPVSLRIGYEIAKQKELI